MDWLCVVLILYAGVIGYLLQDGLPRGWLEWVALLFWPVVIPAVRWWRTR